MAVPFASRHTTGSTSLVHSVKLAVSTPFSVFIIQHVFHRVTAIRTNKFSNRVMTHHFRTASDFRNLPVWYIDMVLGINTKDRRVRCINQLAYFTSKSGELQFRLLLLRDILISTPKIGVFARSISLHKSAATRVSLVSAYCFSVTV